MGDMGLCLTLKKALVTALAETCCRVHNELGMGRKWDCAITGEIKLMCRRPFLIGFISTNLQMNQILLAAIMPRHCGERLPIDTFFINAEAAPFRFVLKNLMDELIDAGSGFAGAGVAGYEPAATKLVAFPSQPAKLRDMTFAYQQKSHGNDQQHYCISKQN